MTPDELMRQAVTTADFYLISAVRNIDGVFGEGYARNNPELVAAFMRACTNDYDTGIRLNNLYNL